MKYMKKLTFRIQGKIKYISDKVIYIDRQWIFHYKNITNCKVGDYVYCKGYLNCMVYRRKNGVIAYEYQPILDHVHILKPIKEKNFYDMYIPKMLVDRGKYYAISDYKGIDTLFPLDTEVMNLSQGYYENLQIRETTVIEKIDNIVFGEYKKFKMLNATPKKISENEIRSLYDVKENLEKLLTDDYKRAII